MVESTMRYQCGINIYAYVVYDGADVEDVKHIKSTIQDIHKLRPDAVDCLQNGYIDIYYKLNLL